MGLIRRNSSMVIKVFAIFVVFHICCIGKLFSQDFVTAESLKGYWKFSIGDNMDWAGPDYDDSNWEEIYVPGSWEGQGFHGYDGYAWYRTSVKYPEEPEHANFYLRLGFIDDVDQVFINGQKIGQTGQFPPEYSTAFKSDRLYIIPHKIKSDDGMLNIAVRVFDEGGEGGFIHGDVAIVADLSAIIPNVDLQGNWKFALENCNILPEKSAYDSWDEITVPGTWEDQGYKDYDGKACYVLEFNLQAEYAAQRMVLLLGRIDDLDMAYLNGELIGQSGPFNKETYYARNDVYNLERAYYIPPGLLKSDEPNVLVVKVLDMGGLGGIWDGSIGLITQDDYIRYWRQKANSTR
jgi:sialate O-acetylesterase